MTINTTADKVSYAGNGVTLPFSFPYQFDANGDLVVLLVTDATGVSVTQVITTNYTVTGAGNPSGGTVTMVVAPPTGTTLVIYRDPPLTQAVDAVNGDTLNVDTVIEKPLDKLTMIAQRISAKINDALRIPAGDVGFVASDMELPAKVERASKFLAFDADGLPIAAAGTSADLGPVSGFMNNALDDANGGVLIETIVTSMVEETVIADTDFVAIRDTSATTGKRMTVANLFAGDKTLTGTLTSTKAAASGFSRVTPNMCRRNTDLAASLISLVRDTITLVTGPAGCTGLILLLRNTVRSGNAALSRDSITFVYSDASGTIRLAENYCTAREQVATVANTPLLDIAVEVHVKTDSSGRVWLYFQDDAANTGLAEYAIMGYYD